MENCPTATANPEDIGSEDGHGPVKNVVQYSESLTLAKIQTPDELENAMVVPPEILKDSTETDSPISSGDESELDADDTDIYSDNEKEPEPIEEDLSPELLAALHKEVANQKLLYTILIDVAKKQLKNLDAHVKGVENIPQDVEQQRQDVKANGWPIKMLKSPDSSSGSGFSHQIVASKPLSPGDLIYVSTSIVHVPIPFTKVTPQDSIYKTKVQFLNQGNLPKSLCCFGCCQNVGDTAFRCPSCSGSLGLPYCKQDCPLHLEICEEFSKIEGQQLERKIGEEFFYFDAAVAKIFQKYKEIEHLLEDLYKHARAVNYMAISTEFAEWKEKINNENMPFSYGLAPASLSTPEKEQLIQKILAVICVFGFQSKHNANVCYLFHRLQNFCHSCVSNTEVIMNEDNLTMTIYASKFIQENELVTIDLIKKPCFPTSARQALLLSQYGIKCQCQRCMDSTELGTYFGNYAACKCPDVKAFHPIGYLVPAELGSNLLWCSNRERYGCNFEESNAQYVEYEKLVVNSIKTLQNELADIVYEDQYNALYVKFKKLFIEITKGGTFHVNFHLVQYFRKSMLKLIRSGKIDKNHCLPCEYVHEDYDRSPTIQPTDAKFLMDMYDQTTYLLKTFLGSYSRKSAYTRYEKAKKEAEYIECLAYAAQKDKSDIMLHTVQKLMPECIGFWSILNSYRNPVDVKANDVNMKFIMDFDQKNYLAELKGVFDLELDFFRKKILKAKKLEMENTSLEESSQNTTERVNILMEALREKERQDEENFLLQLEMEDDENFNHDISTQQEVQEPDLTEHEAGPIVTETSMPNSNLFNLGAQGNHRHIPILHHGHTQRRPNRYRPGSYAYPIPGPIHHTRTPIGPVPVTQRIFTPAHRFIPMHSGQCSHLRFHTPHPMSIMQSGFQMPVNNNGHVTLQPASQPYPFGSRQVAGGPGYQQNFPVYPNPNRHHNFHHQQQNHSEANGNINQNEPENQQCQPNERPRYPSRFF